MNIFISELPLSVTDREVTDLFIPFGTVESVYIVKDKYTGAPTGRAYVVMPVDAEAEQAIAKLQSSDFNGHMLQVSQAEESDFPSGDFW